MKLYVVLSRDNCGFVFVTTSPAAALTAKAKQIEVEEFAGGHPGVSILETEVTGLYTEENIIDTFVAGAAFGRDMFNSPSCSEFLQILNENKK